SPVHQNQRRQDEHVPSALGGFVNHRYADRRYCRAISDQTDKNNYDCPSGVSTGCSSADRFTKVGGEPESTGHSGEPYWRWRTDWGQCGRLSGAGWIYDSYGGYWR